MAISEILLIPRSNNSRISYRSCFTNKMVLTVETKIYSRTVFSTRTSCFTDKIVSWLGNVQCIQNAAVILILMCCHEHCVSNGCQCSHYDLFTKGCTENLWPHPLSFQPASQYQYSMVYCMLSEIAWLFSIQEMSRIAIKGLVVPLIFLCSLIPTPTPNLEGALEAAPIGIGLVRTLGTGVHQAFKFRLISSWVVMQAPLIQTVANPNTQSIDGFFAVHLNIVIVTAFI